MITGDNPIRRVDDDVLGRAAIAQSFARQVLAFDATEGLVVGVLGPWGSGKTSFINLARTEFERAGVPVLDFNPWLFSGSEQLVGSFFVELAAQLRLRPGLAKIGKYLEDYGEMFFAGIAWVPIVGPWIERAGRALHGLVKALRRRSEGISERRTKLKVALSALAKPIVVVLDDLDRLESSEIRDVFKLVRLTASFTNVIYILAFDRARVEAALAEEGVTGRNYLEKILQWGFDLPTTPSHVLHRQILSTVDSALANIEKLGSFDEQIWPDIFIEIIRPLIRNMRDVRRYAAAIHGTVVSLEGQIAVTDVLALEAVRVFLPDVFGRLHGAVDALTNTSDSYGRRGDAPHLKLQIDGLIEAGIKNENVVRAMISRLFPAADRHIGGSNYGAQWKGRWLTARRVSHEEFLRLFLERVPGEGLQAFTEAERAWAYMADRDALNGFLRSLDATQLQDVIASLEAYEDKYAPEHVVPGTVVLLNLLPDLPDRQRNMFELDTSAVVSRVIYRLLRSLQDPTAVEIAVSEILPALQTLTAKLQVISTVGYREGAGHKLVSEQAAAKLEREWRNEVRSAKVDELSRERDLARILLVTKRFTDSSEAPLRIDEAHQLTLALLRSTWSEAISQSAGSNAVRRFPRLAWDVLIELYGDEATLIERIRNLKTTAPQSEKDLLELADKYLGGWRPKEFGDD